MSSCIKEVLGFSITAMDLTIPVLAKGFRPTSLALKSAGSLMLSAMCGASCPLYAIHYLVDPILPDHLYAYVVKKIDHVRSTRTHNTDSLCQLLRICE